MAEGTRFKTGFLPAPISYTNIGAQIGDRISKGIQSMSDEFERKRAQANQTMGFTDALKDAVPAGITSRYQQGAQLLLDEYQKAATKAYRTGVQSDIDEYQRLRGEFIEFKNIATAKSALDNQTRLSIAQGNFKNLSGGIAENLDKYNEYSKADYTFNPATRQLEVTADGGQKYWRDSNIGDMNDVFVPSVLWEGTEFMPEKLGLSIYEDVLQPREVELQKRTDRGFATGELKDAEAYALIDANLKSRQSVRGAEMLEAIQVTGFKNIEKPGTIDLSEADLADAGVIYNEQNLFANPIDKDGNSIGSIGSGSLNSSGKFVFDVSDEEILNSGLMPESAKEYIRTREAIKLYMESSAKIAYDRIKRDNQMSSDLTTRRADEKAAREAAAKVVTFSPISTFKGKGVVKNLDFTEGSLDQPALKTIDDVTKVKASVPGRQYKFTIAGSALPTEVDAQGNKIEVKEGKEGELQKALEGDIKVEVTNVLYNNRTGEMDGFELATGPGVLEGFLLDIDGTPIKSFVVKKEINPDAFQEIETSIRQVAAPSKTKRSGDDFLDDAQRAAFIDMDIEPPSDEAVERFNSYMGALQSITRQQGADKAGEIADIVEGLRLDERIAMESRIFESVQQGVYPTVEDGEIVFPE